MILDNGKKCALLPRYIVSDNERLDLLSAETDLFFYDDVFRKYKEEFKDALVKETTPLSKDIFPMPIESFLLGQGKVWSCSYQKE